MRKKPQFTQRVGEVGVEGIRLVRAGGVVLWLKCRYQDERFIPYVGQEVYIADRDGTLYFNEGWFDRNNKALCGKWITTIYVY